MSYNYILEDRIDHYFISRKDLTKNKQMGGVGWLLNGNMCFGIYNDLLVVRIDPAEAETLAAKPGVQFFGQKENETGRFISLTEGIYQHPHAFKNFLDHALLQTEALPPNKQTDGEVPD